MFIHPAWRFGFQAYSVRHIEGMAYNVDCDVFYEVFGSVNEE